MAIAHINAYNVNKTSSHLGLRNSAKVRKLHAVKEEVTPVTATHDANSASTVETEARGFALYVGIDEETAKAAGTSLAAIVSALRKTVADLVPAATEETYAAVALAPKNVGGRPIDVVRTALRDPRAIDKIVKNQAEAEADANKGIVIDVNRKKVTTDGDVAPLTYKEFELLNYLIQNQGETVSRKELIDLVWGDDELEQIPNERTIDVHIRRLRSKIAGYEDIIRTVRGGGYRFDQHPDVIYEI
jgi:DNA-binding response OmpR family regulator